MKPHPIRLLDDAGTASALRTVLEAGRDTYPVEYHHEEAAARFRATLASGAVAGALAVGMAESLSGGSGLRALLSKAAVKIGLAVFIPAAGIYAIVASRSPESTRAEGANLPPPPAVAPIARVEVTAPNASSGAGPQIESPPSGAARAAPLRESEASLGRVAAAPSEPSSPRAGGASGARAKARSDAPAERIVLAEDAEGSPAEPRPAKAGPEPDRTAPSVPSARPDETRSAAPGKAAAAPVDARSAAAEEMRGVIEARALQRTNPGQALEILARLQRQYPRGYFLEERRAISVTALFRAGNTALARKQGAAFLESYPNGPFTDDIRRQMDR